MLFLEVHVICDVLHNLGDELQPALCIADWFLINDALLVWRHCNQSRQNYYRTHLQILVMVTDRTQTTYHQQGLFLSFVHWNTLSNQLCSL